MAGDNENAVGTGDTGGAGGAADTGGDRGTGTDSGVGTVDATILKSARAEGSYAALTFDDGPNPPHTPRLLEVLRKHGVRAVFCLVGEQAEAHPETVRAIVADGHVLGNHSMHHKDLQHWSPDEVREDLLRANAAIRAAVPGVPIPYFRAPYGYWGVSAEVAAGLGMLPLGWRLDVRDFEPPGTEVLAGLLEDGMTPGAVALLHDGGGDRSQTVDAVDLLVPRLASRGWTFGTPGHEN